jgi:hypothetical protein
VHVGVGHGYERSRLRLRLQNIEPPRCLYVYTRASLPDPKHHRQPSNICTPAMIPVRAVCVGSLLLVFLYVRLICYFDILRRVLDVVCSSWHVGDAWFRSPAKPCLLHAQADDQRDWSGLPEHLLLAAMASMEALDVVNSGAVCSSWRSTYVRCRRLSLPLPAPHPSLGAADIYSLTRSMTSANATWRRRERV